MKHVKIRNDKPVKTKPFEGDRLMEGQFRAVLVDKTGSSAVIKLVRETEELAKVNAELVGADCVTEDVR